MPSDEVDARQLAMVRICPKKHNEHLYLWTEGLPSCNYKKITIGRKLEVMS